MSEANLKITTKFKTEIISKTYLRFVHLYFRSDLSLDYYPSIKKVHEVFSATPCLLHDEKFRRIRKTLNIR